MFEDENEHVLRPSSIPLPVPTQLLEDHQENNHEWKSGMEFEQHRKGQMLNQINDMMTTIFNWNILQGHFPSLLGFYELSFSFSLLVTFTLG